jgi:hypothetical protein
VNGDERAFLRALATDKRPRDIITAPGALMHHKRAWRILEKWSRRGWYEYGVSLDLGWLTPAGRAEAEKL